MQQNYKVLSLNMARTLVMLVHFRNRPSKLQFLSKILDFFSLCAFAVMHYLNFIKMTNIGKLLEFWLTLLIYRYVVFLDLAKAFDKVPHKRLLEKLNKHGIRGKLLSVIGNWLSNRKQRVCIKGRWSK